MVIAFAPGRAVAALQHTLAETMVMLTSEKFRGLAKILDASISEQRKAVDDINAWLKESGIKVPKGVSFLVKQGQLQMTIRIQARELGARGR